MNYYSVIRSAPPPPQNEATTLSGPGPSQYPGLTITHTHIETRQTPLDK